MAGNKHIISNSVQMLLTESYQNYSMLVQTKACQSWRVSWDTVYSYRVPISNWRSKYRDLEILVRGHSRWLEMAPLDRSHMSSYLSSIVIMAISCTVFEIKRYIGRKTPNLPNVPKMTINDPSVPKSCLVYQQKYLVYQPVYQTSSVPKCTKSTKTH